MKYFLLQNYEQYYLVISAIFDLFQLKPQEAEFLAVNTNAALSSFEKVSENMGKVAIN